MEKNFPEKINVSPLLTELINQIPLTEKTSFKFSKIDEHNNLCWKSKMWDFYSRKCWLLSELNWQGQTKTTANSSSDLLRPISQIYSLLAHSLLQV